MESAGILGSVSEFEKVFEDMEVSTGQMDAALDNVYQSQIDQGEVNSLLQEVGDQNVMVVNSNLAGQVGTGVVPQPVVAQPAQAANEVDEMQARLNALQGI